MLYPVVVGLRLKLHPVAVLVAVALGGTLGGHPGRVPRRPGRDVSAAVVGYLRERRECREDPLQARHGVMVGNGALLIVQPRPHHRDLGQAKVDGGAEGVRVRRARRVSSAVDSSEGAKRFEVLELSLERHAPVLGLRAAPWR